MSIKRAILAILDVFGECRESDLFNLVTVGHEAGLFDAGVLKWGVYGFYSDRMYRSLAELLESGVVEVEGIHFKLRENVETDQSLVKFYMKIKESGADPYDLAWYMKATKLFPRERVLKHIQEDKAKKLECVVNSIKK